MRSHILLLGVTAAALVIAGESRTLAVPGETRNGVSVPGVRRSDLAWQHWVLNCQGCHREDGSGSEGTAPRLAGFVARFTRVDGGREYLARVPGVATAALSDSDLAELLNWILWRFDREHLSGSFIPYTAAEVALLRRRPLRTEAPLVRADLMKKVARSADTGKRGT